jgi:hypothetical protein
VPEPTQTCQVCGDVEVVRRSGSGFPPDAAKRRLAKRCKEAGHTCKPEYLAGISIALVDLLRERGHVE